MAFEQRYIILSSPSGGGKTTLAHRLISTNPQLSFSISACTRPQRTDEEEGKDYYFKTQQDFENLVQANQFIEHEQVYPGRYYGTLKQEIERLSQAHKHILFDVDVNGAKRLKAYFGTAAQAIFILPPSVETLKERLLQRATETKENINYRLARAPKEIEAQSAFDQVIENKNLTHAFTNLQAAVQDFLSNNPPATNKN